MADGHNQRLPAVMRYAVVHRPQKLPLRKGQGPSPSPSPTAQLAPLPRVPPSPTNPKARIAVAASAVANHLDFEQDMSPGTPAEVGPLTSELFQALYVNDLKTLQSQTASMSVSPLKPTGPLAPATQSPLWTASLGPSRVTVDVAVNTDADSSALGVTGSIPPASPSTVDPEARTLDNWIDYVLGTYSQDPSATIKDLPEWKQWVVSDTHNLESSLAVLPARPPPLAISSDPDGVDLVSLYATMQESLDAFGNAFKRVSSRIAGELPVEAQSAQKVMDATLAHCNLMKMRAAQFARQHQSQRARIQALETDVKEMSDTLAQAQTDLSEAQSELAISQRALEQQRQQVGLLQNALAAQKNEHAIKVEELIVNHKNKVADLVKENSDRMKEAVSEAALKVQQLQGQVSQQASFQTSLLASTLDVGDRFVVIKMHEGKNGSLSRVIRVEDQACQADEYFEYPSGTVMSMAPVQSTPSLPDSGRSAPPEAVSSQGSLPQRSHGVIPTVTVDPSASMASFGAMSDLGRSVMQRSMSQLSTGPGRPVTPNETSHSAVPKTLAALMRRLPLTYKPDAGSLQRTSTLISQIISDKIQADQTDDRENNRRQTLPEFVYDFFLNKYGLRSLTDEKLADFLVSVRTFAPERLKVHNFARLLGVIDPLPPPATDFYLRIFIFLMFKLRNKSIKDDLRALPRPLIFETFQHLFPDVTREETAQLLQQMQADSADLDPSGGDSVSLEVLTTECLNRWVELSKSQIAALQALFSAADSNGDSVLSVHEFRAAIFMVEPDRTTREILAMYRELNPDSKNIVQVSNFVEVCRKHSIDAYDTYIRRRMDPEVSEEVIKLAMQTLEQQPSFAAQVEDLRERRDHIAVVQARGGHELVPWFARQIFLSEMFLTLHKFEEHWSGQKKDSAMMFVTKRRMAGPIGGVQAGGEDGDGGDGSSGGLLAPPKN